MVTLTHAFKVTRWQGVTQQRQVNPIVPYQRHCHIESTAWSRHSLSALKQTQDMYCTCIIILDCNARRQNGGLKPPIWSGMTMQYTSIHVESILISMLKCTQIILNNFERGHFPVSWLLQAAQKRQNMLQLWGITCIWQSLLASRIVWKLPAVSPKMLHTSYVPIITDQRTSDICKASYYSYS